MVGNSVIKGTGRKLLLVCLAATLTACGSTGGTKASRSVPYSAPAQPAASAGKSGPTPAEQFAEAVLQQKSGRFDEAKTTLEALISKHPTRAAPRINLGILQARSGQWQAARDSLWHVVNMPGLSATQKAVAQNELGIVLRHLGNYNAAETAYQAALKAKPDLAAARLNLAILYDLYLKQPAAAIRQYEQYRNMLDQDQDALMAQTVLWIEQLRQHTGQ